ncbi:MAG: hypothetical protein WBF06_00545 [Candidatus Acidiferrales bacterium]
MDEAKRSAWAQLWDASWFGIGFGMAVGAFGSLLSNKYLAIAGWILMAVEIFRHDLFRKGLTVRIIAGICLSVMIGLVGVFVWHYLPKPEPPLTFREAKEAFGQTKSTEATNKNASPAVSSDEKPVTKTELQALVKEYRKAPGR